MSDTVARDKTRKKKASKNVIINIISKIVILLIGFLSRRIIIGIVSIEYLGLSSLYQNVLDLLNLAELGLGIALQVRLYQPLVDNDEQKIGNILNVARKIYLTIGAIVFVLGIGASFLLQFIIKDSPFDIWYVRLAFIISVFGISSGYFMADKRLYFESNESLYYATITDMIGKVLAVGTGLLLLYLTKEYMYYVGFFGLGLFISNFMLWVVYKRKINCKYTIDKEYQAQEFSKVRKNLKEVIPNKLSVFVFTSTDSIVISTFIGLAIVGIYSNYMTLFMAFLTMSAMVSSAFFSVFGKMFKEKQDEEKIYKRFKLYEVFQYVFTSFTTICLFAVCDKFIVFWMGPDYLLDKIALMLLCMDYFLHSLFQPMSAMFVAKEMFKEDKVCSIISAVMNITISVILVNFIGVHGVIIGTLASNIFNMITRIILVYKKIFNRDIAKRFILLVVQILLTAGLAYGTMVVVDLITIDGAFLNFLVSGFVAFGISNIITIVVAIIYKVYKKKEYVEQN